MNNKRIKLLFISLLLMAMFILWTIGLTHIDVKPIGTNKSCVGYAAVNQWIHRLTGVHMGLYSITDWLGLVPIAFMLYFGFLGLVQWIKRGLKNVDRSILVLGGFYIVVIGAYFLFEYVVINYRPVLIGGFLEASYPSSTTMLVLCVMPTAIMQLKDRITNLIASRISAITITLFSAFMVIGRFLSGVHWFSDIIGGALLSTSLVLFYRYFSYNK